MTARRERRVRLRSADRLDGALRLAGIGNRELAERSGVARSVIAMLRSGTKRGCRLATAESLAAVLDVDVARLFEIPVSCPPTTQPEEP